MDLVNVLEKYWHQRWTQVVAPIVAFASILLAGTSFGSSSPKALTWVFAACAATALLVFWRSTHRIARPARNSIGIVVAIVPDDEKSDRQFRADFVQTLAVRLEEAQLTTRFSLIELPKVYSAECTSHERAAQYLRAARSHLMIYGAFKTRRQGGQEVRLLELRAAVLHAHVSDDIKAELSADMNETFPSALQFPTDHEIVGFAVARELVGLAARLTIAIAAAVSGDAALAEELLLQLEVESLSAASREVPGTKKLAEVVQKRLVWLYSGWSGWLGAEYVRSRDPRNLRLADPLVRRLLERVPNHYSGLLLAAICDFMLRGDVAAAKRRVRRARTPNDNIWRMSHAFLLAATGQLAEAKKQYMIASKTPPADASIAVQCEEFIGIVLAQQPELGQLHYCAALVNHHFKRDLVVALDDYRKFAEHPASARWPDLRSEAEAAMQTLAPAAP